VLITRPDRDSRNRPLPIDPDAAASILNEGDTVVIGHGGAWPRRLVESMVEHASVPFTIVHNRIDDDLPYFTDEAARRARHIGFMAGHATRTHIADGAADFVPNCYGLTPRLLRRSFVDCNVAVLHVAPPDADGWCSFGACVAYLPAAVECARVVVAQINPQMPRTIGTAIHISAIDYVADVNEPLSEIVPALPDATTEAIAQHVAALVADGSVLQLGIGRLSDAILASCSGKRHLRLWTETFSDSALALLKEGAITTGPNGEPAITATFVTGSAELYKALDGSKDAVMLPVDVTNNPVRLQKLQRFVAINSAIEVDLTGQINAESIGDRLYSGPGGHLDFAIGANYSAEGRYICALPSTARGKSRIVPRLTTGATVTVPRSLADIVVTEFGAVHLQGLTLRQRAQAIIEIAHPDHRAALQSAVDRGVSR
jgi:4-hydroxybutyrate CoA-transferase